MTARLVMALVTLSASLSSCATMIGDRAQVVRIKTSPPGARVYLDGIPAGKSPTVVHVENLTWERKVRVELERHKAVEAPLPRKFQWVSLLNLTNPIAWAIDFMNGRLFRLEKTQLEFELAGDLDSTSDGE